MQKERVKENKESIDFQKPFFLNTTCDASTTGFCVRFFFPSCSFHRRHKRVRC